MKKEWIYVGIAGAVLLGTVYFIFGKSDTASNGISLEEQYSYLKEESAVVAQSTPVALPVVASSQPASSVVLGGGIVSGAGTVSSSTGRYAIQIASFSDQSKAAAVQQKASQVGHPAYIAQADLGAKGRFHRVYVGPFESIDEAKAKLGNVQTSFAGSFIIDTK